MVGWNDVFPSSFLPPPINKIYNNIYHCNHRRAVPSVIEIGPWQWPASAKQYESQGSICSSMDGQMDVFPSSFLPPPPNKIYNNIYHCNHCSAVPSAIEIGFWQKPTSAKTNRRAGRAEFQWMDGCMFPPSFTPPPQKKATTISTIVTIVE